jgi:hypothetical protein
MTLPVSPNSISAGQIRTEFGPLSGSVSLGAYRISKSVGTLENLSLDIGIPSSGSISFSNFRGKKLNIVVDLFDISQDSVRQVAKTRYNNNNVVVIGPTGGTRPKPDSSAGTKVYINVNKRIGSAAGNRNYAALQTGSWDAGTELIMIVGKDGVLMGAGGNGGNGGDGGNGAAATQGTSALGIQYSTTLINNGLIFGGRGGGGGGGGSTYKQCGRNQRGCKEGRTFNLTGGGGAGGRGFPGGTGGSGGNAGTSGTVDLNGSNGGGVEGKGTSAGWDGTSGAGGTPETKGENGQGPGRFAGGSGGDRGYAIIINSGVILSKSNGTGTIDGNEVTGTPT